MTREQIENGIKYCTPYGANCYDCPFAQEGMDACYTALAKAAFPMLLEDRKRLQQKAEQARLDTANDIAKYIADLEGQGLTAERVLSWLKFRLKLQNGG